MHGGQVQARSESVVGMVAGTEQDGNQECVQGLFCPHWTHVRKDGEPRLCSQAVCVRFLISVSDCWTLNKMCTLHASASLCVNKDNKNAYGDSVIQVTGLKQCLA